MEVKLLGIDNYENMNKIAKEQSQVVSSAGRLSRFKGDVLEIYEKSNKDLKDNNKFIKNVTSMGHDSITDHDYLVFALKNVSVLVEQVIIAQRFCSFTIKSRREVDFSKAGFYIPDFHDKDGNLLENNKELQEYYIAHEKSLFNEYKDLLNKKILQEDARFILPYSFNSNIIMGLDAHALKDLIVNLTKGPLSKITELKTLGEKLYDIAKERCEYIIPAIDKTKVDTENHILEVLNKYTPQSEINQTPIEKVLLLESPENIDDKIFISAIMRQFNCSVDNAINIYINYFNTNERKEELIHAIKENQLQDIYKSDLKSINFKFQIPVSLATLTHITRHRTVDLNIPDFVPIRDLTQYKIPSSIKDMDYNLNKIFNNNYEIYNFFKKCGVRDEDLVYFYLSGNMLNIKFNMDGKTLQHFLSLRCCNKAQWEIRNIAEEMRHLVSEKAPYFSKLLGPTCEVDQVCHEGKESCGKIKKILKKQ